MVGLIGVDWGSTHIRAFRFDDRGNVAETRRASRGAAGLAPNAYEGALRDLLCDWLDAPATILICGMAGSREGWIEAPYLSCPCNLSALSGTLVSAPGRLDAHIVPGLTTQDENGLHDVLRGEETQILGAQPEHDAWLITPGTHSKWAELRDGAVTRFRTYMTGEVFRLLAAQSALSKTLDNDAAFDGSAFDLGATRGLDGGAITHLSFAVRAQALFGALSPQAAKSYLSGLLIGAEIADGLRLAEQRPIVVVGAEDIASIYQRAFALAAVREVTLVNGETAAARGLWRLAQKGLVQ